MTIQVGQRIPPATLYRLTEGGAERVETGSFFAGRRVAVFFVPGAFTPTCSQTHLPEYIRKADEIRAKGIDEIVCIAVNDPWVMKAWGEQQGAEGKVTLLSDGNAELTRLLGVELDRTGSGMGLRSMRLAMLVDDGVVGSLGIDARGVNESGAEACLVRLG